MEGCSQKYSAEECYNAELQRTQNNSNDPSRQYNFTTNGYESFAIPLSIRKGVKSYYYESVQFSHPESLSLPDQYSFNHWSYPINRIPINELFLSTIIVDQIQPIVEKWIQNPVTLMDSTFRIHSAGSLQAPNLGSAQNVITVIIEIDMDENEEEEEYDERRRWMVEIIDHEGLKQDIRLGRGQMMIYEVSLFLISSKITFLVPEYYFGSSSSVFFSLYSSPHGSFSAISL